MGGRHSYVGGVVTLPNGGYQAGYRTLEAFDFTANSWISDSMTNVTKTRSHTIYTAMCSATFWCPQVQSYGLTYITSGFLMLAVDRSNMPVWLNTTYSLSQAAITALSFNQFDTDPSTYVTDMSIFVAPARYYYSSTPKNPPNVTTVSFYRSFTNDTFARNFPNDNAASAPGEMNWICSTPSPLLIFAQFDVTLDMANLGNYLMCNRGECPASYISWTQAVGKQINGATDNIWFSFPANAFCAQGYPIGTNNCSIASWTLTKAITGQCYTTVKGDTYYPNGFTSACGQYDQGAEHLIYALANCPDIKGTLPPPDTH